MPNGNKVIGLSMDSCQEHASGTIKFFCVIFFKERYMLIYWTTIYLYAMKVLKSF